MLCMEFDPTVRRLLRGQQKSPSKTCRVVPKTINGFGGRHKRSLMLISKVKTQHLRRNRTVASEGQPKGG